MSETWKLERAAERRDALRFMAGLCADMIESALAEEQPLERVRALVTTLRAANNGARLSRAPSDDQNGT